MSPVCDATLVARVNNRGNPPCDRARELEELHERYAREYAHITRMVVSRLGLAVH